jgi:hypothetical protein
MNWCFRPFIFALQKLIKTARDHKQWGEVHCGKGWNVLSIIGLVMNSNQIHWVEDQHTTNWARPWPIINYVRHLSYWLSYSIGDCITFTTFSDKVLSGIWTSKLKIIVSQWSITFSLCCHLHCIILVVF